jgi:hypothetical protein
VDLWWLRSLTRSHATYDVAAPAATYLCWRSFCPYIGTIGRTPLGWDRLHQHAPNVYLLPVTHTFGQFALIDGLLDG